MKPLLLLTVFAACAFSQDQPPACPSNPGVYYLDANAWKPLALLSPSSASDDNMPHGMFTYSRKNVVRYPDPAARTPLAARPRFCTSATVADGKNTFLVKLSEKKDHREVQVGKGTAATAVKVKYRQEDLQPIDLVALSDSAVEITPKQDLTPGQYLLVPAQKQTANADPSSGYDFGVK